MKPHCRPKAKFLLPGDCKKRMHTLFGKSFELGAWASVECAVETTIYLDGTFYRFRSNAWIPPTEKDEIVEKTPGDFLSQNDGTSKSSAPSNEEYESVSPTPAPARKFAANEERSQQVVPKVATKPIQSICESYSSFIKDNTPHSEGTDEIPQDSWLAAPSPPCHISPCHSSPDNPQRSTQWGRLPIRYQTPPLSRSSSRSSVTRSSDSPSLLPSQYLAMKGEGEVDEMGYADLPETPRRKAEVVSSEEDEVEFVDLPEPPHLPTPERKESEVDFADLPEPPQLPRSLSPSRKRGCSVNERAEETVKKSRMYL